MKKLKPEQCLVPLQDEMFLKVFNCAAVKPPRPARYAQAMKQVYRPDYVLSHFVHYSTVTVDNSRYYNAHKFPAGDKSKEVFLDEMDQAVLIHARGILPQATMFRSTICNLHYPKTRCPLGILCPDSVEWIDEKKGAEGTTNKQNNNPHEFNGKLCSCWLNKHVENVWIPKLEAELGKHDLKTLKRKTAIA